MKNTIETKIAELKIEYQELTAELHADENISDAKDTRIRKARRAVAAEIEMASKAADNNTEIKEEIKMKNTIETKIAKNGAVSVYVNGKRTSREAAVKFAKENNLPTYRASYISYTDRNDDKTFATAIAAYAWLQSKANSSRNIADGSLTITRIAPNQTFVNGTDIYEHTPNVLEVNADDEPEFATFIYAKIGAQTISDRYDDLREYFNQLVEDGLTEEQAEQVITVYAGNRNGLEHCKLIKEFKAQNAAAAAEIEQAIATEISEEPKEVCKINFPTLAEFQYQLTEANKRLAKAQSSLAIAENIINENLNTLTAEELQAEREIRDDLREEIKREKAYVEECEEKIAELVTEIADSCAVTIEAGEVATDAEIEQATAAVAETDAKAEQIAAIERSIARVIAERTEAYDELANAEADDETPQWFIDDLKWQIDKLLNEYWELCRELDEIKNTPDTPDEPDTAIEIDEDEAAEKFYRETASTYRKMQAAAAFAREFLREHIFDIYDFDYSLSVRNQRNEYKACPNKFHLVDTRFDVEVDRNDLEYVIYYGRTELARYRTIESVTNAVDQLVIAIVNHRFEFAFPADTPDEPETPEPERTRLQPDDAREVWLSQYWPIDTYIHAEDDNGNEIKITQADLNAIENSLRGKYYINDTGDGVEFFAEDCTASLLSAICTELEERGCYIEDYHDAWEEERAADQSEIKSPVIEYLNRNAPEGWSVILDKEKLRVEYHGNHITDVGKIENRDLVAPQAFFRQFQPLVDKSKTPAQMFLDDRYRELSDLEEMRKSPDNTPESIQTLDEMIERIKRDIAAAEFGEDDTIDSYCKAGAVDENGDVWF